MIKVDRINKATTEEEFDIMAGFIQRLGCVDILEIGTLGGSFGFSLVNTFAESFHLDTIDIKKTGVEDIAKANGVTNITYHSDGSNEFFKQNTKTFDFIFIDGDHSYKQSKLDLENSVKALRNGGIIFMHDIRKTKRGKRTVKRTYDEFSHVDFIKCTIKSKGNLGVFWNQL